MTVTTLPAAPLLAVAADWRRRLRIERKPDVLTPAVADRLAGRIGVHPSEIWPEWWDVEETICRWCGLLTLAGATCSGSCQSRLAWERRRDAVRSAAWWERVLRYSERAMEAA